MRATVNESRAKLHSWRGRSMMDTACMPFGKYRGKLISEIETSYLAWLVRDCDSLQAPRNGQFKAEICSELEKRIEASIPAHIKAAESQEEDQIYLRWWLDRGGTRSPRGFPPSLPSDGDWIPPYELHHSPEWHAFQKRKSEYRERHLRKMLCRCRNGIGRPTANP